MGDIAQDRADVIKGRRRAETMLANAIADYEADFGEGAADEVWFDLVVATAHTIVTDDPSPVGLAVAREFCRTQIGSIPQDLEPWLGKADWIR
jgi:hypothetical protein